MKIFRVSKAGKVLNQPHGPKPSGKLDSQIFLGKDDPSHVAKNRRKKKKEDNKKKDAGKCNTCTAKKKSTEEAEKMEYNPWAVCTESVGRDNEEKYERCVKKVKSKERKKLKDD